MSAYPLIVIKQGAIHSHCLQDPRKEHPRIKADGSPCPPKEDRILEFRHSDPRKMQSDPRTVGSFLSTCGLKGK